MKNRLLILFFLSLVLLSFIQLALASNYYCFTRLKNNESVPTTVNSISNNLICASGKCTCRLPSGDGYCLVCLNSTGWHASYNSCNSDFCSLDPNENVSLSMKVSFPSYSAVVSKNRFLIGVNTSKMSKIDLIDVTHGKTQNLCMHCNSVSRNLFFSEGENKIILRSSSLGETKEETFNFLVDIRKPTIKNTFPASGSYSSGNFSIIYDEDNLLKIELYYGTKGDMKKVVLQDCQSGKGRSCNVSLDLSSLYSKRIDYYFTIYDVSLKNVSSSKRSVFVDNKKPVIKSIIYTPSRNFIKVTLNVSEDNFKSAVYYEKGSTKGKLFCSSIRNGVCYSSFDSRKNFLGKVVVTDKSGNTCEGIINIK